MIRPPPFTQDLSDCRDPATAGGKAVNLGRLLRAGFPVPDGFVITTDAYRHANTSGKGEKRAGSPFLPEQKRAGSPSVSVTGYGSSERPDDNKRAGSSFDSDGAGGGEKREGSPSGSDGVGSSGLPADLVDRILLAYRAMGAGPVAVRSSATAEDMAGASMAGQYETFLHVRDEATLLDSVRCCWASLDSPRTRAYLAEHGIDLAQVTMAVVVQRLVPAEVAGVLFTANPHTGTRGEMLVEASWGLGEAVVSGRVQPDVLRLDRQTGRVVHASIADKRVLIAPDAHDEKPVDEQRRRKACLRAGDVSRLWQLGCRAADHFGSPQDIEWAIHDGELFLLQSRPITTLAEAESYEAALRTARSELRDKLAQGRGPWVLHNLAETLPHPTPLTWSVVRRFMSGAGGYGAMYRRVGFEPSARVTRDGFLHRVAGRVYMDASLAPEMFFDGFPFQYDLEQLRRNPDAGQSPPTVPVGPFGARLRVGKRLAAVDRKLRDLARDFDATLKRDTIPAFAAWCQAEKGRDLAALGTEELIDLWQRRERAVLDEFTPRSLLPSLISGMALADLRTLLAEHFWDDDPDELANLLSSGGEPDATIVSDAHLHDVAHDRRSLADWLAAHGHRAAGEFDLAAPRWRERPEQVLAMAARLKDATGPLERHRAHAAKVTARLAELRAKLPPRDRTELTARVERVRRYVAFREGGKDVLMLGYGLLRDLALEAGRRLEIGEDVFFLTLEDLFDALRVGFAPQHLIAERKAAHRAEERVHVPRVIDADAVEAIGEPPKFEAADSYKAFALSAGRATGPARIVRFPAEAGDLGKGYVLVCPSTDPSWTPLFAGASALVLECGGTLSHGAVVAREMGLPAVVLPDATRLLKEGEAVTVDGRHGVITPSPLYAGERAGVRGEAAPRETSPARGTPGPSPNLSPEYGGEGPERSVAGGGATPTEASPDRGAHGPSPNLSPEYGGEEPERGERPSRSLIPPPPGRAERTAAKWRNIAAVVWGVYLLALFVLPDAWLLQPSLAVLDVLFWPLVRAVGKPFTVAIIAAFLAAVTMLIQWAWTDNARLLDAKRRAARLNCEAAALPKDSPRRAALARLAAPVQWRVTGAAFVPLGLLLGPLVLTFLWFPVRVDPVAWNAPPGSTVSIVATVDSDLRTPVTLDVAPPLSIDASASPIRTVEPIRETLNKLLARKRAPTTLPADLPEELATIVERERAAEAADLEAYLAAGLPPQPLMWTVRAEAGASGKFPVIAHAGDGRPLRLDVVLGDAHPPAPAEVEGGRGARLKSLKVTYTKSELKRRFWDDHWLVVYLLAYLPVMLAMRWALRVA